MCGIVGAWLNEPGDGGVQALLVEGLRCLEYRGYDSSGLGIIQPDELIVRRRQGRLAKLESLLAESGDAPALLGIGHTRWATHGEPSDGNAHPHQDAGRRVALVHNGIIENYLDLRHEVEAAGIELQSATDTEVLTQIIGIELSKGSEPLEAVRSCLERVRGNYAIALVTREPKERLICARQGPPLCIAQSERGVFLASDVMALLPYTRQITFLEDGDIAELTRSKVSIIRLNGERVERAPRQVDWDAESADKQGYAHFMLKEIHEQPDVLARAFHGRIDVERGDVQLEGDSFSDAALSKMQRLQVTACGTALHAGYIAGYMVEGLARVPVDVDYASEFRYRNPKLSEGTYALGISQSGETADTLEALRLAIRLGAHGTCIVNSISSSMVRDCQGMISIEAGPEIGVASTKAFVAMLVASYLLAIRTARARGTVTAEAASQLLRDLRELRPKLSTLLSDERVAKVRAIAEHVVDSKGFLFLGRGINYPVALEGALKLKEISYVHAEGYPAGEMKHGPIALIEPGMTTLALAPKGRLAEKLRSNIEQVKARGGRVICVGSDPGCHAVSDEGLAVPDTNEWLSPILNVVPLQLLSYFIAELKGCDIDKPRNLAKSVTVE